MKYSWILFDADDTIFDFKKSARFALASTLEDYGITANSGHYEIYRQINEETWHAFEKNEINTEQLRRIRFEKFLEAIGEYREPLEMNGIYLKKLSETSFLLEGARQLIADLVEIGHRLGLITNGLKEVQRARIESAALEPYFDVIVVSDEIGVSKPDSGFFDFAFEKMGYPAKEQVLVVGDSLQSDIQGGNNYGIDTCWLNPGEKVNLTAHQPTFEINNLVKIRSIVSL